MHETAHKWAYLIVDREGLEAHIKEDLPKGGERLTHAITFTSPGNLAIRALVGSGKYVNLARSSDGKWIILDHERKPLSKEKTRELAIQIHSLVTKERQSLPADESLSDFANRTSHLDKIAEHLLQLMRH